MGWFSKDKKSKEERKREFINTMKYGEDINAIWKEHEKFDAEQKQLWKEVEELELFQNYKAAKNKSRELEKHVELIIRKKHGLPYDESRSYQPGHLCIYDWSWKDGCTQSPIGYCATYRDPDNDDYDGETCIFCKEKA